MDSGVIRSLRRYNLLALIYECLCIAECIVQSGDSGVMTMVIGVLTGAVMSFDSLEEAVEWAGFSLKITGRLGGTPATDYSANKAAFTVTYGNVGYVSKTLIPDETEPAENTDDSEQNRLSCEINGWTVWFTGEENAVTKAE